MKRRPQRGPGSELAELTVDRLGQQGDGIAEWRGEPVFLPFTVPGDRVRAEIGLRRGAGREGRVVERLAAAMSGRAEPACRHFGRCGGCALQHLPTEAYQAIKLGGLTEALRRARIDPALVAPLRTVPPGRRRIRLGLQRPKDSRALAVVGFRERFSHTLVDLAECVVMEPALYALVAPLRQSVPRWLAPGANAEALLTHCDSGIDLLIESTETPGLRTLEALATFATEQDIARIVWRSGTIDTPIVERRRVRVMFSGVVVPFPPGGFLQASEAAEPVLVAAVLTAIGDRRPVIDLYAGLGTFTFALAGAGPVHAVEGDAAAIAALGQAASFVRGVTLERRDLDRSPVPAAELSRYAAAVFDPPRAGARRQAEALAASAPDTVVAVSCNPATFARDAATLIAGGFRLERVVPVDQFVFTPHLELVATFRR
ncbi:MAG TPA: class I SAM-dependent RNA methyltransferase [Stellaceae bacterium]|nr:class I SAM-dependent RNA methyltransferase [Stellaceae bacterium]